MVKATSINDFWHAIKIQWRLCRPVIQLLAVRSQQVYTDVVRYEHFLESTLFKSKWEQNEIYLEFDLQPQIC